MAAVSYGALPFKEQIAFMRKKLKLSTQAWTDIYTHEHDWAFVVAGANRDAIVEDFYNAITKAIEGGTTLAEFRKDFDNIVSSHGWDYKGGRNWRSQIIYETNLTQSYNAGRYEQLRANRTALPYLRYRHSDAVEHPRKEHLAWDGMVLRADDPWWDTHFPANGWGCQCYVEGLTQEEVDELGLTEFAAPAIVWENRVIGKNSPNGPRVVRVPQGISPGFEYAPGKARLENAVPQEIPFNNKSVRSKGLPNNYVNDSLPIPRQINTDRLNNDSLSEKQYAAAFLKEFGASLDTNTVFKDVLGEPLTIGKALLWNRRKNQLKADKNNRGRYLPLLAQAIKSPDEIWTRIEYQEALGKLVVRKRYIAKFQLADEDLPALAVFEQGKDDWSGITIFDVKDYPIEELRVGIRRYKRQE